MGWVRCPCGMQISDVGDPCLAKAALVTDVVFDEAETRERMVSSDVILESRDVWECYECGCIAIDHPESGSNKIKWYKPVDGVKGDVMKPFER
jgi:hypothetical protein